MLVLLLSCLGVAATTYVTRTFLTHAHTCVVKATPLRTVRNNLRVRGGRLLPASPRDRRHG